MKLTVVQLLPALNFGGVERGTVEIARALVDAGHRAIVVSAGGHLVEELETSGAEHIELPIGQKKLSTVREVKRLARLLQQLAPDIVHARSRLPAWIGYFAIRTLRKNRRPRWVTTVHGPYSVNRYSRIMISGERVIAISDFVKQYVIDNYTGIDPQRLRVIPRGVSRAAYPFNFKPSAAWLAKWHQQFGELHDTPLLTLPARLTHWKGQLDFITVLERLRQDGVRCHGLIVGGAHQRRRDYEQTLRARVSRFGLDDRVTFLGARVDLREIMAISTICYSLTSEPEAFGRTTIEALSLGTPVIGYCHGGTEEILDDVFPPGLVAVGKTDEVVARTQALLANPPEVPRQHRFTLQHMQQATLALYAEICGV